MSIFSHDVAVESWIPDELSHAGRENRDAEHAAAYDEKEDSHASEELAVLEQLGIGKSSTVVDLGAGTGQFALEAASAVTKVVAVDVSAVMLRRLEMKLRAYNVKNVECVLAGFLTYEHKGGPADLVYTRYALHHLPDFWKGLALHRMASILRTGGILRLWDVVYSFEPTEATRVLKDWMSTVPSQGRQDEWTRSDLEEHIRDENSTFTWLLEPMLVRAGFAIDRADYSEDQIFARYVCVKTGEAPSDR